jgi:hypothetical protein
MLEADPWLSMKISPSGCAPFSAGPVRCGK